MNDPSRSTSIPERTPPHVPGPLTDSPWFWLGLFGLAALVGLMAIGPKFAQRQHRLALQSEVREQIWRDRLEQPSAAELAERPSVVASSLPLWPLAAVALAVTGGSWGWLWWQRRQIPNAASNEPLR